MATQNSRESDYNPRVQYSYSFVPVTIAMLEKPEVTSSQENQRKIYSLVCRVEEYEESGDILFRDETGAIPGKIYKNLHKNSVHATQDYTYRKNEYASVVGNISIIQNKSVLIVTRIMNVLSYKEVDFHRAQILWSLFIKNSVLKIPAPNNSIKSDLDQGNCEMSAEQKMVYNYIKINSKGQEMKVNDIKRSVKLHPNKIDTVLNDLVNAGELVEYDGFTFVKLA